MEQLSCAGRRCASDLFFHVSVGPAGGEGEPSLHCVAPA